ncbi:MAG: YihA family ribosome biogenesis GTP-binding protein [Alphaproteobacteria bacterium]|nr:YihA family ribosome biogenesis GTP-binding protein [Alphaproteobacteria bacterium]
MRRAASQLTFLGSFPAELPDTGLPEVAFAGRSNVGKSSALNTLLRTGKAARVSSRPGRTQTINLFQLGDVLAFADLPGYGFAKVPDHVAAAWKPMIEAYLGERPTLRLVVQLVDARLPPQEMDAGLLDGLRAFDVPVLVVATKIDKLSKHQRKPALAVLRDGLDLPDDQPIPFSARSGEGYDAVWDRIERACGKG